MPFIVSWQRRQLSGNSGTITFKVKYQLFIEVFVEVFVGRSTQPPVNPAFSRESAAGLAQEEVGRQIGRFMGSLVKK